MTMHPRDPARPDPVAERRTRSAGYYASVDDRIAALRAVPSHTTSVTPLDDVDGVRITVDDEHVTAIDLVVERPGRLALTLTTSDGTATADLGLFTVNVLADTLRRLTGGDTVAPIVGHR